MYLLVQAWSSNASSIIHAANEYILNAYERLNLTYSIIWCSAAAQQL